MKLAPYPDYKDSGVLWLGKIPAHWDVKPGMAFISQRKEKNVGMKESTVLSLSYGQIVIKPLEKLHGLVPESFETYQIADPGNIIIRGTDLQNDKTSLRVGKVRNRGIITSAYLCLQTNEKINPDYAHLLLHGYDLMKIYYGMGSGLRQNLDFSDFKRLPVLVPSPTEQSKIHKYVESVHAQINKFIRNKRRLIELLKEQKQNVINQAVTRGLDPNVKLKPSGVEWIEDIPEHWDARRLRTLAAVRASGVDKNTNEDEVPVMLCNNVDIYRNEHITPKIDFMKATASKHEIRNFELKAGDLVITKDSLNPEIIGVPSYVPEALPGVLCAYHLYLIRPFASAIESEFLLRAFSSSAVSRQFRVATNGVTIVGLPQGAVKATVIPLPPLEEQRAIIAHINEKCAEISQAISRAEREIELMREYRTRLISDVVTGQVDVRNMKCEGGSLNEDEFEDIEEVEEEIELPEGGEDDE
jgi:type I restriction enzyme S subunit